MAVQTLTAGTLANDATIGVDDWEIGSSSAGFSYFGQPSKLLKLTDFGFSLPASAVVEGILFEPFCIGGSGPGDFAVRLVIGGTIGSTDRSVGGWSGNEFRNYGGATDLWGETPGYADVNASDFGVAIAVDGGAAGISSLSVSVFYSVDEEFEASAALEMPAMTCEASVEFLSYGEINAALTMPGMTCEGVAEWRSNGEISAALVMPAMTCAGSVDFTAAEETYNASANLVMAAMTCSASVTFRPAATAVHVAAGCAWTLEPVKGSAWTLGPVAGAAWTLEPVAGTGG